MSQNAALSERQAIASYLAPVLRGAPCDPILRQIPVAMFGQIWPSIERYVDTVVDRSEGQWTIAGIADFLLREEWQLWVVWNGEAKAAIATEIYTEMSGMKCARVVFTAGDDAKTWVHLLDEIEEWARDNGCERMCMIARKGWARLVPDYKITHVLLEKAI